MSVMIVWVVDPHEKPADRILCSKYFSLVEKRMCSKIGIKRSGLLSQEDIPDQIITQYNKFEEDYDKDNGDGLPLFILYDEDGQAWPILIIQESDVLWAAIPEVNPEINANKDMIKLPVIASTLALLDGMTRYYTGLLKARRKEMDRQEKNQSSEWLEVREYLQTAAPFGCIFMTDPLKVKSMMAGHYDDTDDDEEEEQEEEDNKEKEKKEDDTAATTHGGDVTTQEKIIQPVMSHKAASNVLKVSFLEQVSVYVDAEGEAPIVKVAGSISCEADMQDKWPHIKLPIRYSSKASIQKYTLQPIICECNEATNGFDLMFEPAAKSTQLLTYHMKASCQFTPPVQAVYQLMEESADGLKVKLNIVLKLAEEIKKEWVKDCEIQVPFQHGRISGVDHESCYGKVQVAQEHILVWRLDGEFPGNSLTARLQARLTFEAANPRTEEEIIETKPSPHEMNAAILQQQGAGDAAGDTAGVAKDDSLEKKFELMGGEGYKRLKRIKQVRKEIDYLSQDNLEKRIHSELYAKVVFNIKNYSVIGAEVTVPCIEHGEKKLQVAGDYQLCSKDCKIWNSTTGMSTFSPPAHSTHMLFQATN